MANQLIAHITAEDIARHGVVAAPDTLTGTPAQNKAIFDRLVRELVAGAFNAAVDGLNEVLGSEEFRAAQEAARQEEEAARVKAEQERVSAEEKRESAEKDRVIAEDDRRSAEEERRKAEKDRADRETGLVARAEAAALAAEQSSREAEAVAGGDLSIMIARHNEDPTAHGMWRYVIAARLREFGRPDYGLGGGGEQTGVLLRVSAYTGGAEVSAIVSGVEYDARNMSVNGGNSPDGTLIIKKMEE